MSEFNIGEFVATVGDHRICPECGSTNVHDAEDAPNDVVECSDCGMQYCPDEMEGWDNE